MSSVTLESLIADAYAAGRRADQSSAAYLAEALAPHVVLRSELEQIGERWYCDEACDGIGHTDNCRPEPVFVERSSTSGETE